LDGEGAPGLTHPPKGLEDRQVDRAEKARLKGRKEPDSLSPPPRLLDRLEVEIWE